MFVHQVANPCTIYGSLGSYRSRTGREKQHRSQYCRACFGKMSAKASFSRRKPLEDSLYETKSIQHLTMEFIQSRVNRHLAYNTGLKIFWELCKVSVMRWILYCTQRYTKQTKAYSVHPLANTVSCSAVLHPARPGVSSQRKECSLLDHKSGWWTFCISNSPLYSLSEYFSTIL